MLSADQLCERVELGREKQQFLEDRGRGSEEDGKGKRERRTRGEGGRERVGRHLNVANLLVKIENYSKVIQN